MSKIDVSKLPAKAPEYDLRDLLEAGCHFGHQKSKWNPKMDQFIYDEKEGTHIFDLAITAEQLSKTYNYFYQLGKQGKKVVMVGTKRQAREVVEKVALESGMAYIVSRWMGGFLTNWEQIHKSMKRMKEIGEKFESGAYESFTKFEQARLKKEFTRLSRFFGGLRDITSIPDVIFVVDPIKESIVVKEANLLNVPVVALADSNADPDLLDLIVPANDDAALSVSFIVEQLGQAYQLGKQDK
jgi:small subunit ribosomal protein S2